MEKMANRAESETMLERSDDYPKGAFTKHIKSKGVYF